MLNIHFNEMLKDRFSLEQIAQFKQDFKGLNTIEEKFVFWIRVFNKPYFYNSFVDFQSIEDFYIHPKNEEETKLINELTLEEIENYGGIHKLTLQNLNDDVENFETVYFKAKNKKPVLEKELNRIAREIQEKENLSKTNKARPESTFWLHGYNQSYIENVELDLTGSTYDVLNLVSLYNGYIWGEYHKHIDGLAEDLKNNREAFTKPKTSVRQQILILETLGLLNTIEDIFSSKSNKKALIRTDEIKFLSALLNAGEQSVKEVLNELPKRPALNKTKTEKNYKFISELFTQVGLDEIIKLK